MYWKEKKRKAATRMNKGGITTQNMMIDDRKIHGDQANIKTKCSELQNGSAVEIYRSRREYKMRVCVRMCVGWGGTNWK